MKLPFHKMKISNVIDLCSWLFFLQLLCFLICCLGVIVPATAVALTQQEKIEDPHPGWLDIEQLSQLRIVSVSKYEDPIQNVAAAVYVITSDDIKRSGAKSIPEALRLAPGVQAAQISSSDWAVTIRGFDFRFANKLLVLMDGREIYTPLFSGTYWDVQDTLLEDIDRIEVVRGPGATVWGVNAVNGVINIITKKPPETGGSLLSLARGNLQDAAAGVRQAFKVNDSLSLRVYAKYDHQDETKDIWDLYRTDAWDKWQAGLRMDWKPTEISTVAFQSGGYNGHMGFQDQDVKGAFAQGLWTYKFSAKSEFRLQSYYNYSDRQASALSLGEQRNTVDIDFQQRWIPDSRNTFIWGIGYRYNNVHLNPDTGGIWTILKPKYDTNLFTGFLQYERALVPEKLNCIIGVKVSHDDFVGWEAQPSARIVWTPDKQQTVWASVSRAVRTPGELEGQNTAIQHVVNISPASGPGVSIIAEGYEDAESEKLLSFEIGYRVTPRQWLTLDIATFYNFYDDLLYPVTVSDSFTPFPPPGQIEAVWAQRNWTKGETYGVEVAANIYPFDHWRLSLAYSFLEIQLRPDGPTADEKDEDLSPHNIVSLLSSVDFAKGWQFNAWFRYVDRLPGYQVPATKGIDSYLTLDAGLIWRPNKQWECSLVGQNLLDPYHAEFNAPGRTVPLEIPRSYYAKLTWRF